MTNQQLYLAIGLPIFVVLVGIFVNLAGFFYLISRFDRFEERFDAKVTTLLNTIHDVDTRTVKLEAK
jgi:hypothetical protein